MREFVMNDKSLRSTKRDYWQRTLRQTIDTLITLRGSKFVPLLIALCCFDSALAASASAPSYVLENTEVRDIHA